jgi:hypothetical protein
LVSCSRRSPLSNKPLCPGYTGARKAACVPAELGCKCRGGNGEGWHAKAPSILSKDVSQCWEPGPPHTISCTWDVILANPLHAFGQSCVTYRCGPALRTQSLSPHVTVRGAYLRPSHPGHGEWLDPARDKSSRLVSGWTRDPRALVPPWAHVLAYVPILTWRWMRRARSA